ncbi:glycoside hydrolase family 9 protein [Enterococcus sp.]|uniref:glycoside hydrolase family 9 protein n=1 Tax=Enterococcus sp. TaxID=35783 RepID=UPI003C7902CA
MPLATEDSFEERMIEKEQITDSRTLTGSWQHFGRGKSELTDLGIQLLSPARYDSYPADWPQDGDYTSFGQIGTSLLLSGENWESYNQLKITITTNCVNIINPAITVNFFNDGKIKIPDIYQREGQHIINLVNHQTKEYTLNLGALPRDYINKLAFSINANGSYMDLPGNWEITIGKIRLEKNQYESTALGWEIAPQELVFSQVGYPVIGEKFFLVNKSWIGQTFHLLSAAGTLLYDGKISEKCFLETTMGYGDFSEVVTPGEYQLSIGDLSSPIFSIGEIGELLTDSFWKTLNFVFCERCGCPVSGIHGTCHEDVYAEFRGKKVLFNGGWHDAGDLSQQLVQTAELTLDLALLAKEVRGENHDLYTRYVEEVQWGLDFIFKTRLGEGYRVTSAGVSRWTNNRIGDMDDAIARIHNSPYDNFLICGILAKTLVTLSDESYIREQIMLVLEADYQDALREFEKNSFKHEPIFWEHTYSTSKSTYLATLVWTSALMYQITQKAEYQQQMLVWLDDLLQCQETKGILLFDGQKLRGFFYRDETQKVIQHFNHQAREHLFSYAFLEAKKVLQQAGTSTVALDKAMTWYGDYLKYLASQASPFGMLPSGLYHSNEAEEEFSFQKQHLLVGPEAIDYYAQQLQQGQQVAEEYYLKQFPVWFSFRGNNAVLLSMGLSATIMGNLLNDPELVAIGFNQLKWIGGFNPFAQSLMYGLGTNYPSMYTVSSGEIMGEIPVGVQTFENQDTPYWPHFNNATYKEVWVGLAGKWSALCAYLLKGKE